MVMDNMLMVTTLADLLMHRLLHHLPSPCRPDHPHHGQSGEWRPLALEIALS